MRRRAFHAHAIHEIRKDSNDREKVSGNNERLKRGLGHSMLFFLLAAIVLDGVGVMVNFNAFRRLVNEPVGYEGDFMPRIILLDSKRFDARRGRPVEDMWMGAHDPQYKFYGRRGKLRNPFTLDGSVGDEKCSPAADWQVRFYPTCNDFHTLGFQLKEENATKEEPLVDARDDGSVETLLGVGTTRDAWKVKKAGEAIVLKTIQIDREFSERTTHYQIVDAVATERLTSSPYVEDIYGFCGYSVLNELGREVQIEEEAVSTLDKLRYARDLSAGMADAHGIDGTNNPNLVHADFRHSNVLFTQDSKTLKLSDFNQGYFLGYNKEQGEMCGYKPNFEFWQDIFAAPEECKGKVQTEKTDIYHLGGMMYYILTGVKPYTHNEDSFAKRKDTFLTNGKWPIPSIPKSFILSRHPGSMALIESINECFAYDPKKRPSARDIQKRLDKVLTQLTVCKAAPMANQQDTSKFLSVMPNVLLVGAQKAGTTATASWMFHHKNVCKPVSHETEETLKELHFYDDMSLFGGGLDLYGKHFCHCHNNSHVLDATPNYLPLARRIKETYNKFGPELAKNLKIVMVLREPVAREFSWYNHMLVDTQAHSDREYTDQVRDKKGNIISFDDYLDMRVLKRIENEHGRYGKWVEEWFNNFDRNNIMVMSYDELLGDQPRFMQRMRDFLGLEKRPDGGPHQITQFNVKVSAKDKPAPSCAAQKKLSKAFYNSNEQLYKLLEKYPGPKEEQRPFPKFKPGPCK